MVRRLGGRAQLDLAIAIATGCAQMDLATAIAMLGQSLHRAAQSRALQSEAPSTTPRIRLGVALTSVEQGDARHRSNLRTSRGIRY